ncbi:hypothetical protein GA516_01015 [Lactobacillus pentosus]|nr:hypothetical protein [Lactiplantibacillus pentosus]BBM21640.1 uncharacterized protein SN13T_1675 [Lactiplantibacillus plantarum]MCT0160805.1 hypothetical protein [Lactiplantibacillus pentosus]MCT3285653.1 hypothetical protein [Lactiplantibacillus pentosus]MCT3292535.1 hypothetical protein [Lactiplantibacillus pentosus]MPQ17941.1 hypothetical protein [Lactiplantibacillus pentosus]
MVDRKKVKTFIDTNMLIFAVDYQKDNVFDWIDTLYRDVWIHQEVLKELLLGKSRVEEEIHSRHWHTFDPLNLSDIEQELYDTYFDGIQEAFQAMRDAQGPDAKHTQDVGEKATLAACILQNAQMICSNDADISEVVRRENYCYVDEDGNSELIVQDTAGDFCFYCVSDAGIPKSKVRRFYKSIFENKDDRNAKLAVLDQRLTRFN